MFKLLLSSINLQLFWDSQLELASQHPHTRIFSTSKHITAVKIHFFGVLKDKPPMSQRETELFATVFTKATDVVLKDITTIQTPYDKVSIDISNFNLNESFPFMQKLKLQNMRFWGTVANVPIVLLSNVAISGIKGFYLPHTKSLFLQRVILYEFGVNFAGQTILCDNLTSLWCDDKSLKEDILNETLTCTKLLIDYHEIYEVVNLAHKTCFLETYYVLPSLEQMVLLFYIFPNNLEKIIPIFHSFKNLKWLRICVFDASNNPDDNAWEVLRVSFLPISLNLYSGGDFNEFYQKKKWLPVKACTTSMHELFVED